MPSLRAHWVDYGSDFYAENTWNDTPKGQRIDIAWMNNWAYAANVPTSPLARSGVIPAHGFAPDGRRHRADGAGTS